MNPNIELFRANIRKAVSGLWGAREAFYASLRMAQHDYLESKHVLDGQTTRILTYTSFDVMPEKHMTEILDAIKENPMDEEKDYESIFKWALRMKMEQTWQLAQTLIAKYTPAGGAGGAGSIPAPQPFVGDLVYLREKYRDELAEAVSKTRKAERAAEEARAHERKVRNELDCDKLAEAVSKTSQAERVAEEARAHEREVRDKLHDVIKMTFAERDRKRKRDQA